MADDLGYGDLGCFGAEDICTPHIDRIEQEGIRFTEYYAVSSMCSLSRAVLLSGRLPQRSGINGIFSAGSFTSLPSSEVTIAEILKEKGYVTGIIGKMKFLLKLQIFRLRNKAKSRHKEQLVSNT